MTRKAFKAIAEAVANARYGQHPNAQRVLDLVASNLASACAANDTSQGFQRARFLRACGVED